MASRTLNDFNSLLQGAWRRPVACQNKCKPGACSCQRHIVHVDSVREWWVRKTSDTSERTNLHCLLDELEIPQHRIFPLDYKNIINGEHTCLLVFSLLLRQGRSHLLHLFISSDMKDRYIDITRSDSNKKLLNDLSLVEPKEAGSIVEKFHAERWQYCPLELALNMDHSLFGRNIIPPFCHKRQLGDKGGTASIYWVAVQKDFIKDEGLKLAITESLYQDPQFGECYQMVLKTYCGNKKSVFDLEKEAFSALSQDNDVPIIRYLGCYEHDYGEGSQSGPTYNLLLEYGEGGDLYQSWADETNVPPVRAEEIIRCWESLFKVADAIQHIHNLEYSRHGKSAVPLKYVGWHADIKPDNILIVNTRLKLADFGYSRFAPALPGHKSQVPTEIIQGFTDTYGAPEISRMKYPRGTITGVTQSIDTWSFGCVLSVAATWVVLGFQGIRQFNRLRQLAAPNNVQGKTFDRFHDGTQVLPEIRQWHNYLRGHLRPSDTTTEQVLSLIENNMLQTEHTNRIESSELCSELRKIVSRAKSDISDLKANSRTTDPVVLKALLDIEEAAHEQKSDRLKTAPMDQQPIDPTRELSTRRTRGIGREEKEYFYKTKPLGQTPYRKEILQKELHASNIIPIGTRQPHGITTAHDRHHGVLTESPIHDGNTNGFSLMDHAPAPHHSTPTRASPSRGSSPNGWPTQNSPFVVSTVNNVTSHLIPDFLHNEEPRMLRNSSPHEADYTQLGPNLGKGGSSARVGKSNNNLHSYDPPSLPSQQPISPIYHPPHSSVSYASPLQTVADSAQQTETSPIVPFVVVPLDSSMPQDFGKNSTRVPPTDGQSPQTPSKHDKYIYGINHDDSHRPESASSSRHPESMMYSNQAVNPPSPQRINTGDAEKQAVAMDFTNGVQSIASCKSLPVSVYDLEYNVCSVRRELEDGNPRGMRASLMSKVKERKADKSLAHTYGEREIIFIVDNGASMFEHWPILFFTAETLVKKTAGLDKNGIDLIFTNEGHKHNRSSLKKEHGRRNFRAALFAAAPGNVDSDEFQTDMHTTLSKIVSDWEKSGRRPTTLIILTDGLWKNTYMNQVNDAILGVAGQSAQTGNRLFSIQFIRFGELGKARLEELDDVLCKSRRITDIVDHCSWRSTVEKMLKGSIEGQHDEHEIDEPDMLYDYPQLMAHFWKYNETYSQANSQSASSKYLAPSQHRSGLSRSPSRSSNASRPQNHRAIAPSSY